MDLILLITIILVSSILQTSTGFGFSILATPFLLLIYEPYEAIQINLFLSLFISIFLIKEIYNDIDFSLLKRMTVGSLAGFPIGIFVFSSLEINHLKIGISLVIFVLTILLILKFRIKGNARRDLLVGGLSGGLTTSIGMPGPPLLLYFSGTNTSKTTLRGTTLAFFLLVYLISLVIQVIFVGTSRTVWVSGFMTLPVVFIGLFLGQMLFKWISQRLFTIMIYIILLYTSIYLFIESI